MGEEKQYTIFVTQHCTLPGKTLLVDTNSGSLGTIKNITAPGKMSSFLVFEANSGSHYDVLQYSHMKNGLKFMMSLSMSHYSSFNNNIIQQLHITYLINSEGAR